MFVCRFRGAIPGDSRYVRVAPAARRCVACARALGLAAGRVSPWDLPHTYTSPRGGPIKQTRAAKTRLFRRDPVVLASILCSVMPGYKVPRNLESDDEQVKKLTCCYCGLLLCEARQNKETAERFCFSCIPSG